MVNRRLELRSLLLEPRPRVPGLQILGNQQLVHDVTLELLRGNDIAVAELEMLNKERRAVE